MNSTGDGSANATNAAGNATPGNATRGNATLGNGTRGRQEQHAVARDGPSATTDTATTTGNKKPMALFQLLDFAGGYRWLTYLGCLLLFRLDVHASECVQNHVECAQGRARPSHAAPAGLVLNPSQWRDETYHRWGR